MVNEEKIVVMTQLALYDKNEGAADRSMNSYYHHDYIYKQNIFNRMGACIGGFILLAVYWLHRIFVVGEDIFMLDIQKSIMDSAVFLIVLMVIYTVLGTVLTTYRYTKGQKRLEDYWELVKKLDQIDNQAKNAETGDADGGADADNQREYY